MTCAEFQERIVDLLDTGPEPATDLRDHMNACSACAALYGELRETLAALEPEVHLEASPLLKERTMNEIDRRPPAVAPNRNPWRHLWKPAFAAAAMLLTTFLVLYTPGKPAVAFADVVRNLAVFRPYSHIEETKVGDGKPVLFAHQFIMSPAVRRSEFPDGRVIIFNLSNHEEMWLWPDQKKATKHCYPGLRPLSHPNIYGFLDMFGPNPEFRGTERKEGKKCSVFHSSDGKYNDCTIWIDNERHLPVRVEAIHLQDGRTVIESHFKFDIEIDPALFSLEPPAGYDFSGVVTHEPPDATGQDSPPFQPYSCLDETEKDGKTRVFARQFVLSRTVRRSEFPDGRVVIFDVGEGIQLDLWPKQKRAEKHLYPHSRGGSHTALGEMLDKYTSFGSGPENIGTKIIDGKNCTGFHATDFTNADSIVWVDTQTNLPVRTESTFIKEGRTVIESDFKVGIDTDPARFSLDPPPDYRCKVIEHDK